ncbi:MarR family transcriptional regulator [Vibrio europaeus]|uniref:MarR family transcriptional regulator n=1 Tax=Vibrio europaeus TaxID=300876 RepID=A0A178J7G2_9VIBR|nr:MarR family transcriptional regulator [Vibrio europaeus]MDC5705761.1 MarR family transcriptional regulator [Vibrio europaeus]MDC5711040.1 MarR family transcriptional regulator [Vibrio europaeus]MDC5716130.1 MarR family transcriptional regulator [Vibrio europaeus]MDC5720290.1 MarR family transcriptional regulator [Vibrio europaeus]MDC5723823.1 MarR family transcriptional regulator [Vibrio europaeus]
MSEESKKLFETTVGMSFIATRMVQNSIQNKISKLRDDVNFEQMLVLMELDYEDGLRPSVIAERLHRSKGTMTSLIRHAEKNELIASAKDPSHKNAKRLFLTLKGKKVHDQLAQMIRDEMNFATQDLGDEERKHVFSAMEKVILRYKPNFYEV